jgi:hypothetical protein
MQFIEQQTISSDATIDFTGISGYSKLEVFFEQIVPANDAVDFHCRAYAGGWLSTGIYTSSCHTISNAGGGGSHSQTNDTEWDVVGQTAIGSAANEYGVSGRIIFYGFNGNKYKHATSEFYQWRSDTFLNANRGAARIQTTSALTGLRFYFTSGNLESGTITLYGIKDS